MRFCRFHEGEQARYGLVEESDGALVVTRVAETLNALELGAPTVPPATVAHPPLLLEELALLAPVEPSKIVCVGRNYREHAAELGNEIPAEPLLFLKPPSALLPHEGVIRRPAASQRVDFEGELGVVIGRRCSGLRDEEDVRPYILGYTVVNDVTARDLQKKDVQFTRGKGFDTFCPCGPFVSDEADPWAGLELVTRVNGEVRQQGNTRDFIFPLDHVVRYISRIMTLLPGDLIATGTPSGVGPLNAGDEVEVSVEGVGVLRNRVE